MTILFAVTLSVLHAVEESGERMAVLTTLVGLLELKHLQLEGESGSGSLEADMKLIEVTCASPFYDSVFCMWYGMQQTLSANFSNRSWSK